LNCEKGRKLLIKNHEKYIDIKYEKDKIINMKGDRKMQFSEEEKIQIDNILEEVEEEQKQNGNQLYSFEEIVKKFVNKSQRKENNYRLRDIFF